MSVETTTAFRTKDSVGTAYLLALGTASKVLFPEVGSNSIRERVIHNPAAAGGATISVVLSPEGQDQAATGANTPSGGGNPPVAAVVNAGGTFSVLPGGTFRTPHTGAIQGIASVAASPITCLER